MLSAVSFLLDPGCGAGIANVPSIVDGERLFAREQFLSSHVSYLCGSSNGWSASATAVEAEPAAEKEDENNDDD
jgi:hypothetical protein